MAQVTFRCTEKCFIDHVIYNPNDKVVRPDTWKNENFEPITPLNIADPEDNPDLKEVGAIPGQGPQGGATEVGGPVIVENTGKTTKDDLIAYLKEANVSIPSGANKAVLQTLVDQHKATQQA